VAAARALVADIKEKVRIDHDRVDAHREWKPKPIVIDDGGLIAALNELDGTKRSDVSAEESDFIEGAGLVPPHDVR